jgi:hypothetical protein
MYPGKHSLGQLRAKRLICRSMEAVGKFGRTLKLIRIATLGPVGVLKS